VHRSVKIQFETKYIDTLFILLARRSMSEALLLQAWTICRSAHVSSGHPRRCIVMPFGVVSGLGLGSGVPDFGGDRGRGRGSLG